MAGRGCRAPTLCPLLVSPLGVSSTQPGVSLGWGGISCGWHHHHHQPLSVRDTVKVITPRTGTAARVAGRAGRWAERGQGQSGSTDEGQTLTGPIAASCSTSNTNKHTPARTLPLSQRDTATTIEFLMWCGVQMKPLFPTLKIRVLPHVSSVFCETTFD